MRFFRFLLGLSTRAKIMLALLVVAMGICAIAYFEPHKLFIDEEVNEDFPAPVAVATTTTTTTAVATVVTEVPAITLPPTTAAPTDPVTTTTMAKEPEVQDDQDESPTTTRAAAEDISTTTTAVPTTTVAPEITTTTEAVPEGPVLLSSSEWISLGHPGTGTVLVYRQPDGSHVIRFEDLAVSNGPDLLVILSASSLVNDQNAYSAVEYLSLGDLKGNKGNQNYEVPADVNLEDYQTVAIWCRRFNYTFNAADIHPLPGA